MSKYFSISNGLRGGYYPDSAYEIRVDTRRELKAAIVSDAANYGDLDKGLSKKAIATIVAAAWREAHKAKPAYLPYCLPIKPAGAQTYSYGIFIAVSNRADYLEYEAAQGE